MKILSGLWEIISPNRARTSVWIAFAGLLVAVLLADAHPWMDGGVAETFAVTFDDIVEYFIFAIAFFIVFWVALDKVFQHRKLSRHRWPKREQVISEAIFSMATQFIFLAVAMWMMVVLFPEQARANRYEDVSEYGWAYYALTLFIVFFLHDTAFYWFHRMMHWPPLYRWIHKTHHESRDPTPFTTFHFHPIESILEAVGGKIALLTVMLTMPWHPSIGPIWMMGMIIFNSIGHLGYEIYPSWWHKVPLLSNKTTAMHHYMHHQRVRGNYALYFRFWDLVCKTEFKDYEARYDAMFEREREAKRKRKEEREAAKGSAPQPVEPEPTSVPLAE